MAALALGPRVEVLAERAESAAHRREFRFRFDAVVVRAFGRPAVSAECAAGFLLSGGVAVVSEPPGTDPAARWPAAGLAELGLELEMPERAAPHFALLRSFAPCAERFPRRVGIPTKRPLF